MFKSSSHGVSGLLINVCSNNCMQLAMGSRCDYRVFNFIVAEYSTSKCN